MQSATSSSKDAHQELAAFRSVLRGYLETNVRPLVAEAEAERTLPWAAVAELGALGYLAVGLPDELGGGLGKRGDFVLVEELARVWGSLAMAVMSSALIGARLCLEGGEQLWRRLGEPAAHGRSAAAFALTEQQAGSDAGAMRTVAVPEGEGWRLSGRKAYVACGERAAFIAVGAKIGAPDAREIGLFIVPAPADGLRVTGRSDMDCHRALDVVDIELEDVRVEPGSRADHPGGSLWQSLAGERVLSAALAVGLAQGALEAGLAYAGQRRQFGREIGTFGEIYRMLADSEAEVAAARALGLDAAANWDAGDRSALGPSRAKLFASETAVRVAERAQHVHGGYGQMSEFDVGRFVRDASMGTVGGGTSEVQARIIARELGLPLPGRPGAVKA